MENKSFSQRKEVPENERNAEFPHPAAPEIGPETVENFPNDDDYENQLIRKER